MRRRLPDKQTGESLVDGVARIRLTARMRAGMVAGLIVAVFIQILPGIGHESFEMLVRELAPVLLLGCVALPASAWVARRDERRLRERSRQHLR